MKKWIKILITLLLILIFAITLNCIRNYHILKKIENAGNNFFKSSNYQVIEKNSSNGYRYIYYKDNISLINEYVDGKDELFDAYWENYSTGEKVSLYQEIYEAEGAKVNVNYDGVIQYHKDLATLKLSNNSLFSIILEKDGCYVIKRTEKDWETLYDTETLLPKKDRKVTNGKEMSYIEFVFDINTVTDEMLEKPVPIPAE